MRPPYSHEEAGKLDLIAASVAYDGEPIRRIYFRNFQPLVLRSKPGDVFMWHSHTEHPAPGVITVDVGNDFIQAVVVQTPLMTTIHAEPGVSFSWSDVRRWAEIPPGVCRLENGSLVYKLQ